MKKRHEQKLVILSIFLWIVFNLPFILIFDQNGEIFHLPSIYFYIFSIWMLSVVVSFIIIKRYYE